MDYNKLIKFRAWLLIWPLPKMCQTPTMITNCKILKLMALISHVRYSLLQTGPATSLWKSPFQFNLSRVSNTSSNSMRLKTQKGSCLYAFHWDKQLWACSWLVNRSRTSWLSQPSECSSSFSSTILKFNRKVCQSNRWSKHCKLMKRQRGKTCNVWPQTNSKFWRFRNSNKLKVFLSPNQMWRW